MTKLIILRAVDVCKCRNPKPEEFEFIIDDNNISYPIIDETPLENTQYNTDLLKEKTICDFLHILDQLECGILPDLEIVLEEISLINIYG